jgi:hypothetical protein
MPGWLRCIVLAAIGAGWWYRVERSPFERAGTIGLDAGGVTVERGRGTERILLSEIDRAFVTPLEGKSARLTLALRGGSLQASMPSDYAAAMREAVQRVAPPRPTEVPRLLLRERATLPRILFLLVFVVSLMMTALVAFPPDGNRAHLNQAWGALAAVFVFITLILLPTQALQTKVIAGLDGLLARGAGTTSDLAFIPFSDVTEVSVERRSFGRGGYGQCAVIVRDMGPTMSLPFYERNLGVVRALESAEAIAAIAREGAEQAASAEAAVRLDRKDRPLAEWRAALVAEDGAYRARALPIDEVFAVLEAPATSPERRIAAAVVLAAAGQADRVRAVAPRLVDERTRRALEQAAAGKLDDAALARALGEG